MMDDSNSQSENPSIKYRLTGALFWLGLMVIIVPSWYSHPVQFDPDQSTTQSDKPTVLIEKPFALPSKSPSVASKTEVVQSPSHPSDKSADLTDAQPKKISQNQLEAAPKKQVPSTQSASSTQSDEPKNVNWVVQLVAYKTEAMAIALKERLKYDYDAFVKFFPKNGYYSVRIGPYQDQTLALKHQARLNELLRIDSILIKGQFEKVTE